MQNTQRTFWYPVSTLSIFFLFHAYCVRYKHSFKIHPVQICAADLCLHTSPLPCILWVWSRSLHRNALRSAPFCATSRFLEPCATRAYVLVFRCRNCRLHHTDWHHFYIHNLFLALSSPTARSRFKRVILTYSVGVLVSISRRRDAPPLFVILST